MHKPSILFACTLLTSIALAQAPQQRDPAGKPAPARPAAPVGQSVPCSFGEVLLTSYGTDVFKITVKATGDRLADKLSDAVVAKPVATRAFSIRSTGQDSFTVQGLRYTDRDRRSFSFSLAFGGDHKGFRVPLANGERVYGAGERALPLNRRGYRLALNNNPWYGYREGADNLNYSVPFVTSSAGYGLFFDNPARSYLDLGKTDSSVLEWGTPAGEWSMYVILGNPKEVLASYHQLTGTQPLPPRWAFGNLMSRFGYTSEAQTRDILGKMKAEGIPVEAVIFDLFWFGDSIKGTMGNLDWVNKTKWPAPAKMIADFKKEGVHTILITEPFVVETSKNYAAARPFFAVDTARKPYVLEKFYFGRGGLLDLFRTDAQAWFWSHYRKQMALGVEGWWGDLGEPEQHPSDLYHNLKDLGFAGRLYGADEVHNLYGHQWTKMLYNYYAKEHPTKRLFSLNRSGFAGTQRYGIFPWTGDVSRSWSGFRAQLPTLLGMTMSGVPYVHSDAGGFAGGEGDAELYVRWLQFAAFTPIFRPHGTALYEVEKNAFSFPSEAALIDTPYRRHAKAAIDLRYRLLPYNYSLAYRHAVDGSPLMAPLYYHFPGDTIAARLHDEYLWGGNILVAPVIEKGATSRTLYLPEGRWVDPAGKLYEGRRWITMPVTLGTIPFFFRAGTFTPGQHPTPGANTSTEKKATPFLVYVPSDTPAAFDWYLDDGVTKGAVASGKHTLLRCRGRQEGSTVRLQLTPTNTLFATDKLLVQLQGLDEQPKRVAVNGKTFPVIHENDTSARNAPVLWDSGHGSLMILLPKGMKEAVTIEVQR
ncbi:TIM-barrel domain-containing protein [Flaviaesturariibacter amylovorans]|uniref:Glycoside hydrolase family 31 protein n=1 Tax=Flaviaesturariibacter amylovorans TaxID=1084520 RepID=A0ABP8G8S2_9BACT